jgi:hypothetical protein
VGVGPELLAVVADPAVICPCGGEPVRVAQPPQ